MIRFGVTALDALDFYLGGEADSSASLRDYLKEILRLAPPTEAQTRGLEFEKWLDNQIDGKFDASWETSLTIEIPRVVVRQVGVSREYNINGRKVVVVGRVDAIHGRVIDDWKTTLKAPEYEKYADKWQWRAYLRMFGYDQFQYHVFKLDPKRRRIVDYEMFPFDSYRGMREEMDSKVLEYAEFMMDLERQGLVVFAAKGYPKPGPEWAAFDAKATAEAAAEEGKGAGDDGKDD